MLSSPTRSALWKVKQKLVAGSELTWNSGAYVEGSTIEEGRGCD